MNTFKYSLVALLMLSITGCRTVMVHKSTMHRVSTTPIALGVIGSQKNKLRDSDYKVAAIPMYKQQIRTGVTEQSFNKATYKAYMKNNKENSAGITYVDSLPSKPSFLKISLLDQVTIISELQKEYNQETLTYIRHQPNAEMITSLSVAASAQLITDIKNAEAVFLINDQKKQYALSLVKEGKVYKTVDFAELSIFAYRLSSFCWGEGKRRKIKLFDLVDEASSCPKNTYKSVIKAEEKMSYFKL